MNIWMILLFSVMSMRIQSSASSARCAVTYNFSGGRFGDNLIAYFHARWIAHIFDIPFLYRPFPYSDHLMMHVTDEQLDEEGIAQRFKKVTTLEKDIQLTIERDQPTLYVIPYFPESLFEHECWEFPYFTVDWNDAAFHALMHAAVQPRVPIAPLSLPADGVTIALHIRAGGGFDGAHAQKTWPLKFPSLEYYGEQLAYIAQQYTGRKIYVYLFTDDPNPAALAAYYAHSLKCPRIHFMYRAQGNHHTANVLEDFFALMQCDCLIRADSNFAIAAAHLASYKMVISPAHHHWEGSRLVIDQVTIERPSRAC